VVGGAVSNVYYRIDPERFLEARRMAFISQEKLAEKSQVALSTIQRIERESWNFTAGQRATTVVLLANALGVPPKCLLYDDGKRREKGRHPPGTAEGASTAKTRYKHVPPKSKTLDVDLALDVEPRTLIAEGKRPSPQAAPQDVEAPLAGTTAGGHPWNEAGRGPVAGSTPVRPPAASTNGHKPFHLADVLNLGYVVSLLDRYPRWEASLTHGLLTALVLGGRGIPAFGARAVNGALEDLYEYAGTVSDPAAYLRSRAAELASSSTSSTAQGG
jgi:transcriptional regulator with XRE-family HTH domain